MPAHAVSMSQDSMTKGDQLRAYLEEQGARVRDRGGWQKISCIGPAHARGDRNPSASVNLALGKYHCFACDLQGDVYDLLHKLENLDFPSAKARLGTTEVPRVEEQEVWL